MMALSIRPSENYQNHNPESAARILLPPPAQLFEKLFLPKVESRKAAGLGKSHSELVEVSIAGHTAYAVFQSSIPEDDYYDTLSQKWVWYESEAKAEAAFQKSVEVGSAYQAKKRSGETDFVKLLHDDVLACLEPLRYNCRISGGMIWPAEYHLTNIPSKGTWLMVTSHCMYENTPYITGFFPYYADNDSIRHVDNFSQTILEDTAEAVLAIRRWVESKSEDIHQMLEATYLAYRGK